MNFFKKVLGFGGDLQSAIDKFIVEGTFFEVVKEARKIKFQECQIKFQHRQDKYYIAISHEDEQYELPIHLQMNPVTFSMKKNDKINACFEWQLEDQDEHVGCYMNPDKKDSFKDILCQILRVLANDENIKDHLQFCKELPGIPIYKQKINKGEKSEASSSKLSENNSNVNAILLKEAHKNDNKMVQTCNYYTVENKEKQLVHENIVFVLKCLLNFRYQIQLVNQTGFAFLKKEITEGLNYEINTQKAYIRWIEDWKIVEVSFQGKIDAALSLKYNLMECLYQIKNKKKIEEDVDEEELAFLKKASEEHPKFNKESKVVKFYQEKQKIQEIQDQSYIYENEEVKKGLQKYKTFCQAKIRDFSLTSLGSMMQTLKISQENNIKRTNKKRLFNKKQEEVNVNEILLHDIDTKAFVLGDNGKLYYEDLEKQKLIQEYNPSPTKGIVGICPQFKEADATQFKTFKAISQGGIYQIDPRTKEGISSLKDYSTNPYFKTMAVNEKGQFTIGSENGEIRFYKQIGKNATNKFTSNGDPVLHLDSTKDGKWLLATFKNYLRLLPTETDDDISLYDQTVKFAKRPEPIKLKVSLDDVQKLKIQDYTFVAAKFDESKDLRERYIVSGFGEYTIVWNLGQAIKGDSKYILTKNEGKLVQADFKYNDPKKLIMTTNNRIVLKENKIKS